MYCVNGSNILYKVWGVITLLFGILTALMGVGILAVIFLFSDSWFGQLLYELSSDLENGIWILAAVVFLTYLFLSYIKITTGWILIQDEVKAKKKFTSRQVLYILSVIGWVICVLALVKANSELGSSPVGMIFSSVGMAETISLKKYIYACIAKTVYDVATAVFLGMKSTRLIPVDAAESQGFSQETGIEAAGMAQQYSSAMESPEGGYDQPRQMFSDGSYGQPGLMSPEGGYDQPGQMPPEGSYAPMGGGYFNDSYAAQNPGAEPVGYDQPGQMPSEGGYGQPGQIPPEGSYGQPGQIPPEGSYGQPGQMPSEGSYGQPGEMSPDSSYAMHSSEVEPMGYVRADETPVPEELELTVPVDPEDGGVIGLFGEYKDKSFAMAAGAVCVIGREAKCQIRLHHAKVSRIHCEIRRMENGDYQVTDSSTNGTFYENLKLPKGEAYEVPKGALLAIGDADNVFQLL